MWNAIHVLPLETETKRGEGDSMFDNVIQVASKKHETASGRRQPWQHCGSRSATVARGPDETTGRT